MAFVKILVSSLWASYSRVTSIDTSSTVLVYTHEKAGMNTQLPGFNSKVWNSMSCMSG